MGVRSQKILVSVMVAKLAKENFSLNLIEKKISGALSSLLHAASSQILGISVQGESSGQGCWTKGRAEGRRDPCKDSGTTLIILGEPTNQTAVETGPWSLLQRCERPMQLFSSLMLLSKLQILHSWSWAMCRAIKMSKLCQTKMQPLAVTSPYQLGPVDAERLLCCYSWVDILQKAT